MRVVVIGGTGHVGTYLVPLLVEAGHEVTVVSRGSRRPYREHAAWEMVHHAKMDRQEDERAGIFARKIRDLGPDVVIDMICFELDSARQLVRALEGTIRHFLHCGSTWVHGPSVQVPITEDQPRTAYGEYGTKKAAIEAYLLEVACQKHFPATVLHPGHIVGPGWSPVNPGGNFNPRVFELLANGEELLLPNLGMETLHHVHAYDVAQGFLKAMEKWDASLGESFHVVSPQALTLSGYARAVAARFGREARVRLLPWEEWRRSVSEEDEEATRGHIFRSHVCSIEKAKRLLNYQPRYSSLEAVFEALEWMIDHDVVRVS